MRLLVTSFIAVSALTVYLARLLPRDEVERGVKSAWQTVAYDKQIRFSGLRQLSEIDLRKDLPLERSITWWHWNAAVIETELLRHPFIQKAKVRGCSAISWGCFAIDVQEREPGIIAVVGDRAWIVGTDGGFIAPAPNAEVQRVATNTALAHAPVVVNGVALKSYSPDTVRAYLSHVQRAIDILQQETKLPVQSVEVKDGAEIEVKFRSYGFRAIFDLAAQGGAEEEGSLRLEAARLDKLLAEFGERRGRINSVDLAYNKIAVVTLKP